MIKFLKTSINCIKWTVRVWVLLTLGLIIYSGVYMLFSDSIYYGNNDRSIEQARLEAWGDSSVSANRSKKTLNFAKLRQDSPDFQYWLSIDGTSMDFPVMSRGDDTMFYRTRDCFGNECNGGTPFIDGRCNNDLTDKVTIIYGEVAGDDRLFSNLRDYVYDKNFSKEHGILTLYGKDSSHKYKLVAAYVDDTAEDLPCEFKSATDYAEFLNSAIASMEYQMDTGVDIRKESLVLSSCYPSGGKGKAYVAVFQPV